MERGEKRTERDRYWKKPREDRRILLSKALKTSKVSLKELNFNT